MRYPGAGHKVGEEKLLPKLSYRSGMNELFIKKMACLVLLRTLSKKVVRNLPFF